jgi:hypothetical protein
MLDSMTSPAGEWCMGAPDGFPGRGAGSFCRLGKARETGASARGAQLPLHAREIVESSI